MTTRDLSEADQRGIADAIELFEKHRHRFEIVANNLVDCFSKDPVLAQWIHFIKYRLKDRQSLADKLARRAQADPPEPIDASNLFDRVHDLV